LDEKRIFEKDLDKLLSIAQKSDPKYRKKLAEIRERLKSLQIIRPTKVIFSLPEGITCDRVEQIHDAIAKWINSDTDRALILTHEVKVIKVDGDLDLDIQRTIVLFCISCKKRMEHVIVNKKVDLKDGAYIYDSFVCTTCGYQTI